MLGERAGWEGGQQEIIGHVSINNIVIIVLQNHFTNAQEGEKSQKLIDNGTGKIY